MTLKDIVVGFGTTVRSIWMIGMHAFAKRETQMYPEEPVYLPPRYRGRIAVSNTHHTLPTIPNACISRWYPTH